MSSQMTILQTQAGNLDDVDANSVATQLNTLMTQIETAYQVTAPLQKLSLAQYLPTWQTGSKMFEFAYNDIVDDSPQAMRAQEGRALDQVLELLHTAAKAGHGSRELVTALFQLRRLWSVFLDDLNSPENGLPVALRAGIISIGIWVNKEIDRIRSGATRDLSPLIEINQIIRDGLNWGDHEHNPRAGERLYLNGAVIRLDRKATIELLNDAAFLLETPVIQASEATTPLRQLYFVVQMMLR
jgi:flagellar biosynthesis activator protein FlaF